MYENMRRQAGAQLILALAHINVALIYWKPTENEAIDDADRRAFALSFEREQWSELRQLSADLEQLTEEMDPYI